MSWPSKTSRFGAPRVAADGHQQRRFAGAVGADQGDDLARLDFHIDALQRLDGAVEGVNASPAARSYAFPPRGDFGGDLGRQFLLLLAKIGPDHVGVAAHIRGVPSEIFRP